MDRVTDWVSNLFPNGYHFANYLSNFISSVDKEFTIKAERFISCKTEDEVGDLMEDLMELKFPIHSRRIECLNPSLQSVKKLPPLSNVCKFHSKKPEWKKPIGRTYC